MTEYKNTAVDFSSIAEDIVPLSDNTHSLGVSGQRFRGAHLGQGTLYITDATLGTDAAISVDNGVFNINGVAQAQLPNVRVTNLTFNDNTVQTTAAIAPAYGSYESTVSQSSGGTTSANLVTFNTTTSSSSTSLVSSSQITYATAGTYAIDFNGMFSFTGGASNYNITVWYAKNGTAVTNSAYTFTTTSAQASQVMGHITDIITVAANDYIQFYWWAGASGIALTATAAGTNPTRPASSSATLNTWRVA